MNKEVKMIYKKVKISMPHCPECKERLMGDGATLNPYRCKCGIWHYFYNTKTRLHSYFINEV